MIKRKDIILIVIVLLLALFGFGVMKWKQKDGKEVVVTINGNEVYRTTLSKNQTYKIPTKSGLNVMKIKDGKVTMKKADCPDQICHKHKAIEKSGETIVCLPHKVVIEVSSDKDDQELDGMTR